MITFGRFGHVEDKEKEKENFLYDLNILICRLSYSEEKKYTETEIIKPLKEKLKREENSYFNGVYQSCFSYFLTSMGLSYYNLTQKEREEILDMDFTYKNWEKKSFELIQNFIERLKNASPHIVWFCFEDIGFVFHIQIIYNTKFKFNNLITYIRDYFILDNTPDYLKEYRNPEKYNEIKGKVIEIYPLLKKRYGINKVLEKFLSYISTDNDYNYEETKKILDNYDNNKKNNNEDEELIKFKYKQD
jgi:hypothetical protein